MKELISVIINVYNGEKFIRKCLESIINQTYKNLEILIVDDGSTDDTIKICKSYKDKRIKIITTKHIGISLARNIGIEKAKGKYYYFVDVDDYVTDNVIEYLYNLCKTYNTKISTCKSVDIYNYNSKIKNKKEKIKVLSTKEMLKLILLSEDRSGTMWNKLISKDLFNNLRCEDRVVYDVGLVSKLILSVDEITYSNQIKYFYLRHKESITGVDKTDRAIDLFESSVERYERIKKVYPNFIENEVGLMDIIMLSYFKNDEVVKYLDNKKTLNLFKKLFSIKIFFSKISFKKKIKILLFIVSPKLCKYISKKYTSVRYKYKM